MKPYYTKNNITIYCADMRDIELPKADLFLTDPPYAEETHTGARTNPASHAGAWRTGGNEPQALIGFESFTVDEQRECFDHIGQAAQAWAISFMDWHHIYHFEQEPPKGLRFVRFGVWVKPNGAPQFTGDRPGVGWEGVAFLHRKGGRMSWNGGGHHAVYTCPIAHQDYRISDNPTSKPIPLIAQLMQQFSKTGDLVVDPFMGSGTTLAVASLLGRRAVGIDRDERQCAALVRWLERPVSKRAARQLIGEQPTLFDLA